MIDLSSRRARVQPLTYRIIGVGGAGVQALGRLMQNGMASAPLIAADTDLRLLEESGAGERLHAGCEAAGGMGTGGDPEVGQAAFAEMRSEWIRVVAGVPLVILLGGLGGGTASGGLPLVAREAKESGAMVVAVVTLPFTFEGKRRSEQALEALKALEGVADLVLCFENDRMSEIVSPSAGIAKAFSEADAVMAGSVDAILQLLNGEGLIHLGFADLKAALPGIHSRALFGYGMAEGSNRPFDALARALRHPLMDKGKMLAERDAVIVQVTGGPEMTLHEVELLMEELNRHVGEGTQILFGTSAAQGFAGWMTVTLLASVRIREEAREEPKPAVESFAVVENAPPVAAPAGSGGMAMIGDEADLEGLEELAPKEEPPPKEAEMVPFVQEEVAEETPEEDETEEEASQSPEEALEETGPQAEEEPIEEPEVEMEETAVASASVPQEVLPEPEVSQEAGAEEGKSSSPFPFSQTAIRKPRAVRPLPGRDLFSMTQEPPEAELPLESPAETPEEQASEQEEPATDAPTAEEAAGPAVESAQEEIVEPIEPVEPVEEPVAEDEREESVPSAEESTAEEPRREPARTVIPDEPALPEPASTPAHSPEPKEPKELKEHKVPQQGTLKFDSVARGRFEKSEPTIVDGEDLDIPTYLRRNLRIRLRS